jgi:N-6 DNA Methylase
MRTHRNTDFTTVRVEGAILPAGVLKRIADGDVALGGLDENAYHLTSGEKANEAVSASWNRLLGSWANYKGAVAKLPANSTATTETRDRWLLPLFQELGYGRLIAARKSVEVHGKTYPVSHFWNNVPIHLVGSGVSLDKAQARVPGAARTSPHGLIQEFLNRTEDYLWAFISNGKRLRVLRDNSDLVRQAFVEFDLESMMEGEVYSDFVLLWLLCHQSRVEAEKPVDFWLEKWSHAAQEQGIRALESLRKGVEEAITFLGKGFLAHRSNGALRAQLKSGGLNKQDYYRQLLRLVYRLLFLTVAEDREVLLDPNADERARERYTKYYSIAKLRSLAGRRYGSRHSDLYVALRLVMQKLGSDVGCPELGLPALGSFLFSKSALPNLEECEIANYDLLNAVRALAFTNDRGVRWQVDYKNLGSEELGSVYESLLELHPELHVEAATFSLSTTSGNERKTTGSYYTPTSLINSLLDSALEPVLDAAGKQKDPEAALLNLKVCDPACGSGHFLIAAAHRIAKRLAQVRTGDIEPSPEAVRHSLRDVVGRCIYGVDINPMAVELCKVSLWMEAVEPGRPLSFLDHHILCGNSLIGTTPALIEQGIPDEAFKPIEGDDPEYCREYKRRNRDERRGERYLPEAGHEPWRQLGNLVTSLMIIDGISDDTIEGVRQRQERYENLVNSSDYRYGGLLADAWCAAFVWKKQQSEKLPYPITEEEFHRIKENPFNVPKWMEKEIKHLAAQYQFFHWHLAFPGVFHVSNGKIQENTQAGWKGGFHVVLGNPPWEKLQTEELQFFAARNPEIAALKGAKRKSAIRALQEVDPALDTAWRTQRRIDAATVAFIRNSAVYPLTGVGKFNTFALFAELNKRIMSASGRVGCIVPSGIATDDTTKLFFQEVMKSRALVSLYDFENRNEIFSGVHRSYKFCLLTLTGRDKPAQTGAEFAFFAHATSDLKEPDKRFVLSAADIALLNPNTLTCPIFRTKRDATITESVYRRVPIFLNESNPESNPYQPQVWRLVNTTDDSKHFVRFNAEASINQVPVIEAKTIHQFDHRFATFVERLNGEAEAVEVSGDSKERPDFESRAHYYVTESFFRHRMPIELRDKRWFLTARNIARSTDERTVIAAIIPRSASCEVTPYIEVADRPVISAFLTSVLNSFVLDYIARQKVGGTHLSYFILYQLPVLHPSQFSTLPFEFILPRALELTFTSYSLEDFANGCGYFGSPFRWDRERRFILRAELDAAFFYLYGISREDVEYILETFPIVKRKDEQQYGEYRTKRVILEIYDEITRAVSSGKPYQTRLEPPPADPHVAHSSRVRIAPLVLPTGSRYPQPDEGLYEMRVILSMLQANSGSLNVQQLMTACRLLAMPNMLEGYAVATEGDIAHEWRRRFCDTFNPESFLPILDDLVRRGEIRLTRQGDGFVVSRMGTTALATDADIEFDTRLALRVAASLSPAEQVKIAPMATQQQIEARSRVA